MNFLKCEKLCAFHIAFKLKYSKVLLFLTLLPYAFCAFLFLFFTLRQVGQFVFLVTSLKKLGLLKVKLAELQIYT